MTMGTDEARAYLWELQAQIAQARGPRRRHTQEKFREDQLEALRRMRPRLTEEEASRAAKLQVTTQEHWPPLGPDEYPGAHWIIHTLADRLEKHLDISFTRPVLGFLATGEVNAVTMLAPGSRTHLVVFEDELLSFTDRFSKAVALAIPIEGVQGDKVAFSLDPDKVRRHLQNSPDAVRRFREVVLAYLLDGEPGAAPTYELPRGPHKLAHILKDGMELFVLGHEYGHALSGHLSNQNAPRRMLGTAEADVTEVTWRWDQENAADIIGVALCAQAMSEEHGLVLPHAGIELFFCACEVLERALSLLMTGRNDLRPPSPTHPPTPSRRDFVRSYLRDAMKEGAGPPLQLGAVIHEVVNILWTHTAPAILDLHRKGVAPDPRWTANLKNP
ncbi:hypothetical protein ACIQB5_32570 [Streptomyces sp. NPDC088560]|uniref:hypothetical protein n=1 Tax=Streptomyces sp. NPDC088560 TaxID=3365868 RepID=UPI00381568D5